MAGYSLQGQDNPSSFSVEKIGIVSVVFTGVTFVTFVISAFIICFLECRDKPLCKRCNFSTKRFSTAVPEGNTVCAVQFTSYNIYIYIVGVHKYTIMCIILYLGNFESVYIYQ